ncbi:MAG: IucA/IucC family protein, partial [Pseudomonadota bacterium]|nr:IucA/IucC family protein [Pseudomonadota bacterium]
MNAVFKTEVLDVQANTICHRVVDALLRENVRDCISLAEVVEGEALPFKHQLTAALADGTWLWLEHLGGLYIPVEHSDFMQPWRLRDLSLIQFHNGQVTYLDDIDAILDCFQQGLNETLRVEFIAFASECQTAISHSVECAQAREDYFIHQQTAVGKDKLGWAQIMLHYERLAAFLDHPFYPTARAKLGFSTADLSAYAPEFGATFRLRWLAVSRSLYQGSDTTLPEWWPLFKDVGLPEKLATNCCLLPVHPFMWQHHLQALLKDAQLSEHVVLAPKPFLDVAATLSVRTVVVQQAPQWHLKLPLSIRTLGAKNIRTIKPSTIKDGHTMQSMLRVIADNEPTIHDKLLLTDESRGAEVADKNFLGFILRAYPAAVEESTVVSVAALVAKTPLGITVFEDLAQQFYAGNVEAFFEAYVALTLRLHLIFWIRYGVALESNQ